MGTTHIKMTDCDKCVICDKFIGKGHDPAVCSDTCLYWYNIECDYNAMVTESKRVAAKSWNKRV